MTVCATHKSFKYETFHDCGDLENMVKVKHMICIKRSCHHASWIWIWSLYLEWLLSYGHLSIPLVIMGKLNFGLLVRGQRSEWPHSVHPRRYWHAWLEVSWCTDVKTCHQSLQTDGRTSNSLSLELCDLWSAKLKSTLRAPKDSSCVIWLKSIHYFQSSGLK